MPNVSPGVECLSTDRATPAAATASTNNVLLLLLFQTFRRQDQRLALKLGIDTKFSLIL